jgi:pyridoxamine 5'-phosphate oxidase
MEASMNHAEEIWKTLVRATVDKKHPWRVVGFSTAGPQGPQVRSVILRAVNTGDHQLVFYTDRRSQKMIDIAHDPRVALLFWNPRSNTQLRVCGIAAAETSELIVNRLWERIPEYARKDYATLSAPGTPIESASCDYAIHCAKDNFSVLNVRATSLEFLQLDRSGHTRVRMEPDKNGIWGEFGLIP